MNRYRLAAACIAAAALSSSALNAQPAAGPGVSRVPPRQCFFANQWSGWRPVDSRAMLIRVNLNEVWRIEFAQECPGMLAPGVHWISKFHGDDVVCSPIDLDLSIADTNGFREACIVTGLHKLSPEEVAKIPRKNLP